MRDVKTTVHKDPTQPRKVSHYCGSIEAAPEKAATSLQGLTKSAPAPAKTQGASMASPQDKPALRPDDPRHGTTRGFHAGCRDACCRRAIARYEKLTKHRRRAGISWAIPATGTQRRLQALMALGWTSTQIAHEAGWGNRNGVFRILHGQKGRPCLWVERKTYRTVAEVYERLHMTVPEHTPANARTRSLAAKKGYAPPLMWDDIDNDLAPAEADDDTDTVDEVKVQRILNGWLEDCNMAERFAVIERWDGSIAKLEQLTGWHVHRMMKREAA